MIVLCSIVSTIQRCRCYDVPKCLQKDQVVLLQTDKELLHSELHKRADDAKAVALQLQDTVTYYQAQVLFIFSSACKLVNKSLGCSGVLQSI